jgi:hypothetical protein
LENSGGNQSLVAEFFALSAFFAVEKKKGNRKERRERKERAVSWVDCAMKHERDSA